MPYTFDYCRMLFSAIIKGKTKSFLILRNIKPFQCKEKKIETNPSHYLRTHLIYVLTRKWIRLKQIWNYKEEKNVFFFQKDKKKLN